MAMKKTHEAQARILPGNMRVKALEDYDCPSHKVGKGKTVDLPKSVALAGIKAGALEQVSQPVERAVRGGVTPEG